MIRREREQGRSDRKNYEMQKEIDKLNKEAKEDPEMEFQRKRNQTNILAQDQKERDDAARKEGRTYADELLSRDYKGMSDQQRQNQTESANAQINRDVQGYEKKLLAQQGRRGVGGGAAFAQRQDLARAGLQAQQQSQRDISDRDSNMATANRTAAYNVEQGNVAQDLLRRQMAQEEIDNDDEKKYLRKLSEESNKIFQRV